MNYTLKYVHRLLTNLKCGRSRVCFIYKLRLKIFKYGIFMVMQNVIYRVGIKSIEISPFEIY